MDRLCAAIAGSMFHHSHRASLFETNLVWMRLLFIFNFTLLFACWHARTLAVFERVLVGGCGCTVVLLLLLLLSSFTPSIWHWSMWLWYIDILIHIQGCHRSMAKYIDTVSIPADLILYDFVNRPKQILYILRDVYYCNWSISWTFFFSNAENSSTRVNTVSAYWPLWMERCVSKSIKWNANAH